MGHDDWDEKRDAEIIERIKKDPPMDKEQTKFFLQRVAAGHFVYGSDTVETPVGACRADCPHPDHTGRTEAVTAGTFFAPTDQTCPGCIARTLRHAAAMAYAGFDAGWGDWAGAEDRYRVAERAAENAQHDAGCRKHAVAPTD